jgi:hypothetical protein
MLIFALDFPYVQNILYFLLLLLIFSFSHLVRKLSEMTSHKTAEKDFAWKDMIRFCSNDNSFTCGFTE